MGSFYYFDAPPQEYIIDLGEIEKHKVWIKPEPKTSYYLSVDVNMKKRQVRGFGGLLLGVVGGMIAEGMAGPNYGMVNINSNYYRTINAASAEYQILPVEEKIAIEKLKEMEVILPSKK